jgi:3-methyladenine DNA glycosylase AlkD
MSRDDLMKQMRARLASSADPVHAELHQAYHKSQKRFYGLRAPQLKAIFRDIFPSRQKLDREELMPLVDELWLSDWAEENWLGSMLLARLQPQLTPEDLPFLKELTHRCQGWGWLDGLALETLGPLALRFGEPVYREARTWTTDQHMWTRRAAVLIHIVPARKSELAEEHAWPTFEELLPERDFFIRKAIGWALRECSKHYPEQVREFLARVGNRASGLTRREGMKRLDRLPPRG